MQAHAGIDGELGAPPEDRLADAIEAGDRSRSEYCNNGFRWLPDAIVHAPPGWIARSRWGTGMDQAGATFTAARFRSSRLNATPTRWIGSPRSRYFSA